jgi:hypothetical protein
MLVYGDGSRLASTRSELDGIAAALRQVAAMPPGIERHGELVSVFIATGALAQGIADAEFEARGCDARSLSQDAAMDGLVRLAEAVRRSWMTGFAASPIPAAALELLARLPLPERVGIKRPEGYAFYALYPESYLQAAAALAGISPLRVVGIRSIGTGLAALVAAATAAPCPVSVRPTGDPFRRRVALCEDLAAELAGDPAMRVAVADEGPGLSGSSFGAVADALTERGLPGEQMHFFPSHGGDLGPASSARHRARWASAPRHHVDFDALVLRAADPAHRLESWVSDLVGAPEAPLEDLSGGAWRSRRFGAEAHWPPCHVQQERRKILLRTRDGTWLLKFAGLGRDGARKLELARQLYAAGFTAEPAGWRHGFLVERWIEPCATIDQGHRARLVERLAEYIGFRAATFPAGQGASLRDLLAMARRNTTLALGDDFAERVAAWQPQLDDLQSEVRAVCTDNRLHPWEWLQTPDGKLLKTDALDHHAAHDLVGSQDVTWDIAGATVEFALSDEEADELCRIVARVVGRPVHRRLLALSERCYAAFQLGTWSLAAESLGAFPAEADRTRSAAVTYAATLKRFLSTGSV